VKNLIDMSVFAVTQVTRMLKERLSEEHRFEHFGKSIERA
jgi:hypothetical protein